MSKFKSLTYDKLKQVVSNKADDKSVMRDMMFMCIGMWTDNELTMAYAEGIISKEDLEDLRAGNDILLN
jgi:hypothetical protein